MAEKPAYEELERRVQELEKTVSEYKLYKDALQNSEAQYSLLFEHANIGIFIAQDGYLKIPNPYLSKILGYSRAELEEQPFSLFIHPEYLSMVNTRHRERLSGKTGLPQTYEFRIVTKNGKCLWVQLSTVLIQFKNRPATVNFLHDISERRQAEEALRKSEERFNLAMDASKDGIWDWDLTTGYIYCSPALTSMLGYDSIDVIEDVDGWQDLIHPEDRQKAYQANLNCVNNLTDSFEIEYRMKTSDGGWKWILGRGQAVYRDASGKALRMIGTHQDITERKQAEEVLKENEQKFRTIFNSNMDSISLLGIGPDGKPSGFIDFNDAACDIFGYTREELMMKKLEDLEISISNSVIMQRLESLQTTGRIDFETVIKDKKGNDRYVEVRAVLMKLANQPAIMNISRDISERKQAEARILYLKKSESLARMAGAVAHHFNNILMITIGHLELVQEDIQQGSVIADNIKQAALAAHRAVALSQLMLTYLGHGVRKNETIDLTELCRMKMKDLSNRMSENIGLTTQFEFTGLMLHSDRSHLEQVLEILFENAVEALAEQTSKKISVSLEPTEISDIQYVHMFPKNWHAGQEVYARLVFSDTGKGMAEETIHQIFDPFYSDKFTGRGLGLAVALGIVKAHGGCICVQSKIGQGTDFIIMLPIS